MCCVLTSFLNDVVYLLHLRKTSPPPLSSNQSFRDECERETCLGGMKKGVQPVHLAAAFWPFCNLHLAVFRSAFQLIANGIFASLCENDDFRVRFQRSKRPRSREGSRPDDKNGFGLESEGEQEGCTTCWVWVGKGHGAESLK